MTSSTRSPRRWSGHFFLDGRYEGARWRGGERLGRAGLEKGLRSAAASWSASAGGSARARRPPRGAWRALGFAYARFSQAVDAVILADGLRPDRVRRQAYGWRLHVEKGQSWLLDRTLEGLADAERTVVDGLRFPRGSRQPRGAVRRRLRARARRGGGLRPGRPGSAWTPASGSWAAIEAAPTEVHADRLAALAGVTVRNDCVTSTRSCVAVRAAAASSHDEERTVPVSVVVGGQYGSEGKGKVAAAIARTKRTPPSSSGSAGRTRAIRRSTTPGVTWKLRQLPAASVHGAEVVLPSGSLVDVEILRREVEALGLDARRVHLSPYRDGDRGPGTRTSRAPSIVGAIGSTGSGTGAALARRVSRSGDLLLAKDCPASGAITCGTSTDVLARTLAAGR